jgi:hypothetical protein
MNETHPRDRFAEGQFELVFRMDLPASDHSPDIAALRSRAQALVKDVLSSRLAVETETCPGSFLRAQGFSDVGKALAATRALQVAFEGFRSTPSGSRTHISVILDASSPLATSSRYAGPSVEQRDLFEQAKTSQVLVTQALFSQVSAYTPLAVRSFAPRAGVYEFLWTSVERLNELQTEMGKVPELVVERLLPVADAEDTVIYRPSTNAPVHVAVEPKQLFPDPVGTSDYGEPVEGGSRFKVIAFSSLAVVLVCVAGLGLWYPHFANFWPRESVTKAPAVDTRSQTVVDAGAQTVVDPPPPSHPEVAPVTEPTPNPPQPAHVGKAASKPVTHSCSSEISIPSLLAQADNNRNHRRYVDAKREYKQVLECEPGNRDAIQGLAKTKADEELN